MWRQISSRRYHLEINIKKYLLLKIYLNLQRVDNNGGKLTSNIFLLNFNFDYVNISIYCIVQIKFIETNPLFQVNYL